MIVPQDRTTLCMHIYIYIDIDIYIYIRTCVYIMCIHVQINVYVYTLMYTFTGLTAMHPLAKGQNHSCCSVGGARRPSHSLTNMLIYRDRAIDMDIDIDTAYILIYIDR